MRMSCLLLLVLYLQSSSWLTVSSFSSSLIIEDYPIAKPGCLDECGNVSIPYPFGIGDNCYHNASYEIVCDSSSHPPKAFLRRYSLEVVDIQGLGYGISEQRIIVRTPVARNMCTNDEKGVPSIDFRGSPYLFFLSFVNSLMVWGCSGTVVLKNSSGEIVSGCASVCAKNFSAANVNKTNCYGVGCCHAPINGLLDYYEIFVIQGASQSPGSNCRLAAALVYQGYDSWELNNSNTVNTALAWQASVRVPLHQVRCYDDIDLSFRSCSCMDPYAGNPYLENGCKAPRECRKCKINNCNYNETTKQYYCGPNLVLKHASIYGFSSGTGLVLLILGCYCTYRLVKWRRDIKRKANNFKKNGGLLLQQQTSSKDGIVQKVKIFSIADMEKATDNFHESRILGQGGQGTVYKGMLTDGRIVAIKKSTKVDEDQLDQFINELVILSQVNHRNVVKLLGCCLETEVPLLVYEFIPNGALCDHIHDPSEDFHVTWKMRLQIAAESAGAIAYLHSASSAPIYHRDIKSSNILLDDKFRAKVSDFGSSRAVNIEQTHVTTRVQGTYGYLDPEYFQSNQFTEKSDVYSFGVVLVELVTGKKPIFPTECGEYWKSLAIEFLSQMEESRLFDIIDMHILDEAKEDELIAVADLARKCLNMNGRLRPTMTEVERVLDGIRSPISNGRTDANKDKCLVVTKMDDWSPPSYSVETTFFTASDSLSSPATIEVLPLISDT